MVLQDYLRTGGTFAEAAELYAIKSVRHPAYPNLILFKYSQIASDMSLPIVQESRGVILDERDDWRVVSRGFDKFFNYGEPNAAEIDWATAVVQEKVDGSLCTLYEYAGEWHVATTGNPDAGGRVNDSDNIFSRLFWETLQSYLGDASLTALNLPIDQCFLFELTTPHNRVIVNHIQAGLTLLAVRHRVTGEWLKPSETTFAQFVPIVREFPLQSFSDIQATFETMSPLEQEGYVVVDAHGNRVKVKHPGYVALHHMKDGMTEKSMLEVIQRGEVPEVTVHFPNLAESFNRIKTQYDTLAAEIDAAYVPIKSIETQKDFAAQALAYSFSSALFSIRSGKAAGGSDFLAKAMLPSLMRLLDLKEEDNPTDTDET
ncbi:MAG: RNA ligase [Janthinobacterium lividum]